MKWNNNNLDNILYCHRIHFLLLLIWIHAAQWIDWVIVDYVSFFVIVCGVWVFYNGLFFFVSLLSIFFRPLFLGEGLTNRRIVLHTKFTRYTAFGILCMVKYVFQIHRWNGWRNSSKKKSSPEKVENIQIIILICITSHNKRLDSHSVRYTNKKIRFNIENKWPKIFLIFICLLFRMFSDTQRHTLKTHKDDVYVFFFCYQFHLWLNFFFSFGLIP